MWCRRKESLGKVGEARRGPQRSLASVHKGSSRSEAQQPSEWPPTWCLQGILQETQEFLQEGLQFFYRMFWNGMFEDGWLMEDAWMVMEVGWGSEVTQELMDGVVRWCGKLTWLEGGWDNNGEEGKVTWQKRRWEMREQTWWWRSWSERGSNERAGDEDALHSGYLIKPTTSCMQSKYHVIYLTS